MAWNRFKCKHCGKVFDTYAEMVAHIATEHPGKKPRWLSWLMDTAYHQWGTNGL
jgi:5-methylcytosine-specific restriction endonuclease McrA